MRKNSKEKCAPLAQLRNQSAHERETPHACIISHVGQRDSGRLNTMFTIKRTPNSGTIRLTFSLVCTIGVFLLILFALILMIIGLAGELLGPALVGLGHDLLLSAGGIF